ncbi:unnamed protein product [Ambrosiozyma monospora]|uniref:Unnamed protein product n=1 Tax=Ambrosiozyma monospora TaxID=43982 RepID=A0A9W6YLP0_AMBMO|nr:unnamed protein product [Ambrosiozyma monospora]
MSAANGISSNVNEGAANFSTRPIECHLVILIHGLWGLSSHMDYLEKSILSSPRLNGADCNEKIIVYKSDSNENYRTYDGIDLCGARVADEIISKTNELNSSGYYKVTKFSCVGYSLGGVIGRYAVGVLYLKDYFVNNTYNDDATTGPRNGYGITPVNFTSFCSPHVGVLTPGDSISVKFFNWGAPYMLGTSGQQMFLKDKSTPDGIPLLKLMTMPNSVFYKSLSQFKKLSLYSNVRSDIRTSWWCSGISNVNPFEVMDKIPDTGIDCNGLLSFDDDTTLQLGFLDGYDPIILDVNKPIKFTRLIDNATRLNNNRTGAKKTGNRLKKMGLEYIPDDINFNSNPTDHDHSLPTSLSTELLNFITRKLKWVSLLVRSTLFVPVYLLWTFLTCATQTFTSNIRVFNESFKTREMLSFYFINQLDQIHNYKKHDRISSTDGKGVTSLNSPRPGLTRKLSQTYVEGLDKLTEEVHNQGDEIVESLFDAMLSNKRTKGFAFKKASAAFPKLPASNSDDNTYDTNEKTTVLDIDLSSASKHSLSLPPKTSIQSSQSQCFETTLSKLCNFPVDEIFESETASTTSEQLPNNYKILKPFKLGLSQIQREIISNLNTTGLKWEKFPIYIKHTEATHAAAIVRFKSPELDEGKIVVQHFVSSVFAL